MAHFAKINENNEVLSVLYVEDKYTRDEQGFEDNEAAGQAYLEQHNNWPAHLWIKTSYNTLQNTHKDGGTPFRGNYAGIGYIWDSQNKIFWPKQPFASWSKDITNAKWVSPLGEAPQITAEQQSQNESYSHAWTYDWNETLYQSDNTAGWVLVDKKIS
jgi:hypothetical protein